MPDPRPLGTQRRKGILPKGPERGGKPVGTDELYGKAKEAVNSGLSKLGLKKKKRPGYGPGMR